MVVIDTGVTYHGYSWIGEDEFWTLGNRTLKGPYRQPFMALMVSFVCPGILGRFPARLPQKNCIVSGIEDAILRDS